MAGGRRLVVMRHAKAEPFAPSDDLRHLTDRGRRDAAAAGAHLSRIGAVPDYAVVSTAARTVETWEEVARATGSAARARYDRAVYHGGPEEVIEALRVVPDGVATLIYVGHNPAAAHLARLLSDGAGDSRAVGRMQEGYPTSAMAVMDVEVPWTDLGPGTGRVVHFHVGRG